MGGRGTTSECEGEFPDYHSVVRDICESAKVKPNEHVIEELYQERLAEKSFGFRQLDPGVVNMITQLRELGYLITVVSNTTRDEVDSWSSCQLGELIDDPHLFVCSWIYETRTGDLLGSTQATRVRCFGGSFCRRWRQFGVGRC